jgi:pimeloyl-ACP methyl ester carboxylesterase
VRWEKVVAVGHSLGAGYAALAALRHPLERAVALGWADWCRGTGAVADWVRDGGSFRTPASRRFALVHERDETVPCEVATRVAAVFCGEGRRVSVESGTPPWDGARLLSTDFDPSAERASGSPCHNCLALDLCTPRWPDGSAVLEDAWTWMLAGGAI